MAFIEWSDEYTINDELINNQPLAGKAAGRAQQDDKKGHGAERQTLTG